MKSTILILIILFFISGMMFSCSSTDGKKIMDTKIKDEIAFMKEVIKGDPQLALLIEELGKMGNLEDQLRDFYTGQQKAKEEWLEEQAAVKKVTDWGTTKSLVILPLVEWYSSREDLTTEAGVSYLIKTDNANILFDLGMNEKESDPSPLLYNMGKLGISLDDIDIIVISHNHSDHVGGTKWEEEKTFSFTTHQIDLGDMKAYTPVPMTYPGLDPVYSRVPTVISEGVSTIGAIPNELFLWGETYEQAIGVHVEGKGIILISGCGHQTMEKIIERAESLFKEPIYGLVGGLHYPVTDSREVWKGIDQVQRYMGTGKEPWRPITMEEVRKNINLLREHNPGVVGLSPHDSCDEVIETFREAFPEAYQSVEIGRAIVIDS